MTAAQDAAGAMPIEHTTMRGAGVDLHVATCGPEDGELVVFLHGFPEYWGAWKEHMQAFAARGYRCAAPDQRGYGTSEKPPRVRDYCLDVLADDIVALIDGFGRDKALIVSHDWGAVVGWWLAHKHGDRIRKAAMCNVPHPYAFRRVLFFSPTQVMRSWYMFFFQLPRLPESFIGADNFSKFAGMLRETAVPGTFSDEEIAGYIEAWSQPGALTSMVNWYRAGLWAQPKKPTADKITIPVLLIWGTQDHALGTELIEPSLAYCEDGRAVRIESGTHWVNHEEKAKVVAVAAEFFEQS